MCLTVRYDANRSDNKKRDWGANLFRAKWHRKTQMQAVRLRGLPRICAPTTRAFTQGGHFCKSLHRQLVQDVGRHESEVARGAGNSRCRLCSPQDLKGCEGKGCQRDGAVRPPTQAAEVVEVYQEQRRRSISNFLKQKSNFSLCRQCLPAFHTLR